MVHSGLVTTPDSEVNSQVLKLLQRAGVKQLSPFDIVHHHILPILKSEEWQVCWAGILYLQNMANIFFGGGGGG